VLRLPLPALNRLLVPRPLLLQPLQNPRLKNNFFD
jgi:hypothetical protein